MTVEPLPLPDDQRLQAIFDAWPEGYALQTWPRSVWLHDVEMRLREHYPTASSDRLTLTARLAAPFPLALPRCAVRVLVCGSRALDDADTEAAVYERLAELPASVEILHGGAAGPDIFAYRAALDFGYTARTYLPDWKRDGKRAGFLRNLRMLDASPDLVLAFWDGKSAGTKHTLAQAERRSIPVEIIRRDPARPLKTPA